MEDKCEGRCVAAAYTEYMFLSSHIFFFFIRWLICLGGMLGLLKDD